MRDDRIIFCRTEPPGLEAVWTRLALHDTGSPKLWMDAYPAAFAVTGAFTLVTNDPAFLQFEGVDLHMLSRGL